MIPSSSKTPPGAKGRYGDWTPGIVGTYEPAFDDGRFWSKAFVGVRRSDIPGIDPEFMPILREVIDMPDLPNASQVITAIVQLQGEVRKLNAGEDADPKAVEHWLTVLAACGPEVASATKQTAHLVKNAAAAKSRDDIAAAADSAIAALAAEHVAALA